MENLDNTIFQSKDAAIRFAMRNNIENFGILQHGEEYRLVTNPFEIMLFNTLFRRNGTQN